MNLIVAVDQNWGIGKDGSLLFSIPEDMQYFRRMTLGKTVVMGRSTLESLPGGKPFKNRNNIVLSKTAGRSLEGAVVCATLEEALREASKHPSEEVFVIGGESVYRAFLNYCARAYVTKIAAVQNADRFFPDLDELPGWNLVKASEPHLYEGLSYVFCEYENGSVKEY